MQKSKKREAFDDSFYKLAGEIAAALERNKELADEKLTSTESQKQQVEDLLDAEKKFRATICQYTQSTEVYKKFLQKICMKNRNILSARPYFRETSKTFSANITPAIKMGNAQELKKFDINYQLIKFIKDNWLGPFPKRANELFNRVEKARSLLIENNMPLAVNRAKLFYRKTPRSHLTLMDLIGICSMGLVAGIDKWCGPYTPVFRSVCIGRMVGNLIEEYSSVLMHLFPSDKRILYKANSIRGRQGIDDVEQLADAVNKSFKQDQIEGKSIPKNEINAGELVDLLGATSLVSADATVNDEGYGVYSYAKDSGLNVEESMIERESTTEMIMYAEKLPMIHKKILKLKGIKI